MNKFILLAGIILVAGLTAVCLIQRESAAGLRERNQAEQQQLAQLAAENERLVKRVSPPAMPQQRSADDQMTELLRLRNEVSMLRKLTNAPRLVEQVTLLGNVSVAYDPTAWKLLRASEDAFATRFGDWEIKGDGGIQITVRNYSTRKTENEFKQKLVETSAYRGDLVDLVGERHESWGGHDWFVMQFRFRDIQPDRLELWYFLPTDEGHLSLQLVGEEASVSAHREAIETFISQLRVGNHHAGGAGQ